MKLKKFRFAPLTLCLGALCFPLCYLAFGTFGDAFYAAIESTFELASRLERTNETASFRIVDAEPAPPIAGGKADAIARLSALRDRLELRDLGEDDLTTTLNSHGLGALIACLGKGSCSPGQEKVILLASYHFWAAETGHTSGESIWAGSTIRALRALNHTLLFSWEASNTLLQYQFIPEMIPVILWEPQELEKCFDGDVLHRNNSAVKDPLPSTPALRNQQSLDADLDGTLDDGRPTLSSRGCGKTHSYPLGIPVWKSFAFHFWGDSKSPLGPMWTLSPYDRGHWKASNSNQYLGYSIEETCRRAPVSAVKEPRGLLLGKYSHFYTEPEMSFPHMLQNVAQRIESSQSSNPHSGASSAAANFSFVGTPIMGEGETLAEDGVEVLPVHGQGEWLALLAGSAALVGLGWPTLSPSPFDALCLGVPFINVIHQWDEQDPTNRAQWMTQHDALLSLDPPYIYHVKAKDSDGLQKAMQAALDNPIESYIVPGMTSEAVLARHKELVETDWLLWAEEYIEAQWEDTKVEFLM